MYVGKIWDNENVHDLGSVETEFPACLLTTHLHLMQALSCEHGINTAYLGVWIWHIEFLYSFRTSRKEISTNIGGEFLNLEDLEVLES
ncbi:hypothetical protein Tco_0874447 [Tanacetum coccineum]|uniref:Uncharacterized protein n=1 Tax=Tanacetum coccineum TaxID=301880 RepID=A0ABQ5BLM7_9ASTR